MKVHRFEGGPTQSMSVLWAVVGKGRLITGVKGGADEKGTCQANDRYCAAAAGDEGVLFLKSSR